MEWQPAHIGMLFVALSYSVYVSITLYKRTGFTDWASYWSLELNPGP